MSFTANTMFEVKVSNSVRNQTQNIAGKFGSFSGTTFTAADCSAGTLVTRNSLLPVEGYEGFVDASSNPRFLNGNAWYMVLAANGTSGGRYGDHTGIYACNTYDVQKFTSGALAVNLGAQTLGLGVAAGTRGDYTEIIVGEQYAFGSGNFSTAPSTASHIYATITNGFLVASTSAPAAGTGVYFKILRKVTVNEGASKWGTAYVLEACRTAESA